jgi:Family of unknown function (DUF6356)
MLRRSRAHLRQAGESYFDHLRFASVVALMMIGAGLACLIHAIVPALCQTSASATVRQLERLFENRHELGSAAESASGAMVLAGLVALSTAAALPVIVAAPAGLAWAWTALAFAIPATFLSTNPQLEPVRD